MRIVPILPVVLVLLVASTIGTEATSAPGTAVQASVSGVIPDNLPRPRPEAGLGISYPKRGVLDASTTQLCGDGAVSAYADAHPSVDFVNSGDVHLVLGYWVAKAGTDRPVPTAGPGLTTWFPIGVAQVPASGGDASQMVSVNKAPAGAVNTMNLLADSLSKLAKNTGFSMPAGSAHSYDIHVAMTMCKTLRDPSQVTQYRPTPVDILAALASNGAFGVADATITSTKDLTTINSFSLKVAGSSGDPSVAVTIGNGLTQDLTKDPFYGLAMGVLGLNYPTKAKDVSAYINAMAAQVDSNLTSLGAAVTSASRCKGASVPGVTADGPFWWEPYQLQLTCQALSQFAANGASLAGSLQALLTPASLPQPSDFYTTAQALAGLLIKAALVQETQITLQSQYAGLVSQDKCFIPGEDYIDKVMGSVPLDLMTSNPVTTYTMNHPEPDLAHAADYIYRGVNGDKNTMYGMSTTSGASVGFLQLLPPYSLLPASGSAMPVTLGTPSTAPAIGLTTMVLHLNVRGVGCTNGSFFCLNTPAPRLPPWAGADEQTW